MSEPVINWPKAIYRENELPVHVVDYLNSCKAGLISDYLDTFPDLPSAIRGDVAMDRRFTNIDIEVSRQLVNYINEDDDLDLDQTTINQWKYIPIKFVSNNQEEGFFVNKVAADDSDLAREFPTAVQIMKKYFDYSDLICYSSLDPRTVILRHTAVENRQGDYLRVHVPLIIPDGDVFLEVNGEEVKFSDGIFGFNSQISHSSHNYSDEPRLILILDLSFEFLNLAHPGPYKPEYALHAKPFYRRQVYPNE